MALEILPTTGYPSSFSADRAANSPAAIFAAWNRGVSPSTLVARRGDLRLFGMFAWRTQSETGTIRRVIEALVNDPREFRALAERWHEHERARGSAIKSLARRWGSLASLVETIARVVTLPRARTRVSLGARPRETPRELTRRDVAALVAKLSDARAHSDAIVIGLLGLRGMSETAIADLRVHQLRALRVGGDLKRSIEEHTRRMQPSAWAFGGRVRGNPCAPSALRMLCERHGTTAATLRRAAKGAT